MYLLYCFREAQILYPILEEWRSTAPLAIEQHGLYATLSSQTHFGLMDIGRKKLSGYRLRHPCEEFMTLNFLLDLTVLKFNFFNAPRRLIILFHDESSKRLRGILESALLFSSGNLSSLNLGLKQLVLPTWNLITVTGFETTVRNWEGLESTALVGNYFSNIPQLIVMCQLKRILSIPTTLIYVNNLASQSLHKPNGIRSFLCVWDSFLISAGWKWNS
ncbi:hypothetical protein DVH24_007991 [Malus domestica]|uniref:Uncharacterized protein n=1 Tax=Malus domestica TaxID=3750 RepID=A0A498JQF6_MALDO|nr:hypothetical protein DVH24_007991 [Malus domestica]